MTQAEKRALLEAWQAHMQAVEARMDVLRRELFVAPESPLWSAISQMQEAYTHATSDALGWSRCWLEAWWLEAEFGDKPMECGWVDAPWQALSTLDELLEFMESRP